MEKDFAQEQLYIKAKKRVNDIKGFYVHLIVTFVSLSIIIAVNLVFVPGFHFFWLAAGGMLIGLFFHWLGVFGFNQFGLSKEWEERKIKEIMKKNSKK